MTSSSGQVVALRKSRRLASPSDTATDVLAMPNDCELVSGTFVVFQWQRRPCILQVNLTQYCWGGHRSGALELVLEEHGLTHSPQLHHISSKLVSDTQWSWLREIFVVVRRLFDANEACDTVRKVHWLNIVECHLAYDLMLRQCHRYHCNLYPTGSLLGTHLKRYGVELDAWYGSADGVVEPQTPSTPPSPAPQTTTPPSSADKHGADTRRSSLGEREWLSDIHLANLMFLLLHGQLDLPLERRDDFQCLYPMTDQLLMRTLAQAEPGSLLWHAKSGRGITVVLVNPDNNHWRLVVLDGLQRQVVLFDPLGRPLPESIVRAVGHFMGPTFRVTDMMLHVQAEGWNCGVWCLYVASRYIRAALSATVSTMMDFSAVLHDQDGYAILNELATTTTQHRQNRAFANELRTGYAQLLDDAATSGRLLYSADDALVPDETDVPDIEQQNMRPSNNNTVSAGTARSALQQRRFHSRPLAEQVWVDLTEQIDCATSAENEEAIEQSLDDLSDQFIEFREDNIDNPVASALRYSLPATLQSDVLKEQIEQFRAYRRERFSLFRRGPLVEETTIASNISSLLRFLGYLHYEHELSVLDLSVFELDNISQLVLEYVEWLERRRGSKPRSPTDKWQPVSCATVANYLNSLVSIVKFQLRQQLEKRDPLLDQLRNLRSQAESYSFTAKRFEKAHPMWTTWAELQKAREQCRAAFDEMDGDAADSRAYLLHLRELCLLCLFTICPPPRCSVVRLLEWDKTLVASPGGKQWHLDLSDVAHAATRHKTHKRKGALRLPLPKMMSSYLTKLKAASPRGVSAVFPPGLLSASSNAAVTSDALMDTHAFTYFVKRTFRKYTPGGQAPNPSLLRSIFTTWLYSLRYDTEDGFLQQIKASSAKWKAHSERVAGAVYNKEQVYQKREFTLLLSFCEEYAMRHAYDRQGADGDEAEAEAEEEETEEEEAEVNEAETDEAEPAPSPRQQRQTRNKRRRSDECVQTFTVEKLLRIRSASTKQVLVQWEGYRRPTWEPYDSVQQQLPELLAELEASLAAEEQRDEPEDGGEDESTMRSFLDYFIAEHHVDQRFRWVPDRLNQLEHAAACWVPPIHETADQLRRAIVDIVRSAANEPSTNSHDAVLRA